MSKAPSMPMYWDAYLADTTHLTTEEHGAYILLLAAMWRRDGSVPDDDKDNARIIGLSKAKWCKIKTRLSSFLIFENDTISQKNLQKIWEKTQEKIQKNIENGRKGGRPISNKNNDLAKANGLGSVNQNVTIPEPEPEEDKKNNLTVIPKNKPRKDKSNVKGNRLKNELGQAIGLPAEYRQFAVSEGHPEPEREWDQFFDYWIAKAGQGGVKLDWPATWRNWVRRSLDRGNRTGGGKNGPNGSSGSATLDGAAMAINRRRNQKR